MLIKKIAYHDLDGDEREDDFYFAMNETQYARVNRQFPGGLQDFALRAAKNKNADDMFLVIDTLVRESYGEKVNEGFVKVTPNGQKLADFFINTEAYDNLLIELMQNEDNLVAFMTGCLNKNAQDRVQAEIKKRQEEEKKNAENAANGANAEQPKLTVVTDKK